MEPLVSIVVPVYNAGKYVEQCVHELLKQSYKNIEIILVNDGSVDNSRELCGYLSSKFYNVKSFHQNNEGVSSARNKGTVLATGDYIMYMDADDYLVYSAISDGMRYMQQQQVDMVIAREIMTQQSKQVLNVASSSSSEFLVLSQNEFDELRRVFLGNTSKRINDLGKTGYVSGGPCERIIKAEIAKKVVFPIGITLGEDKLWNLRLLNNCKNICVIGDCWYQYIIYEDSAVRKFHGNRTENGKQFINILYQENKDFCDRNKEIYLENIAIMLYCVAFYDLTAEECQMSSREKKEYIKRIINEEPWNTLWSNSNSRHLSRIHRIMLPLYKTGHWVLPLCLYRGIKNKSK